jgi:hypothetical protein
LPFPNGQAQGTLPTTQAIIPSVTHVHLLSWHRSQAIIYKEFSQVYRDEEEDKIIYEEVYP